MFKGDIFLKTIIKISDLIAQTLAVNGIKTVFGVSGGAALHLLNSVEKHPSLKLVTTHHEGAAAMAADAVGRIENNLGVAIATSGPGATNLITGIAGCYYDSIPALYITGQVSTTRLTIDTGVRQTGFQETPIVQMIEPVTKYAVQISDPQQVLPELVRCIRIAKSGRKGPTLIDIPDDIQRMNIEIEPQLLDIPIKSSTTPTAYEISENLLSQLGLLIKNTKRPLIVIGSGAQLSGKADDLREFVNRMKWPVALTWGAADLLPSDNPYRVGTFGTHGIRSANITVQNADLILFIGTRLDSKSTGTPISTFAQKAKRIFIDIDKFEIEKFKAMNWKIDLELCIDMADISFSKILEIIYQLNYSKDNACIETWNEQTREIKEVFKRTSTISKTNKVDPYLFMQTLSQQLLGSFRIFLDTGCTVAWAMQEWDHKPGQRVFHDFNNTAMGWALPAGIASLALQDDAKSISIIGDGSFMMSLQELATLKTLLRPLKIFIINNSGYSMIKQTQDQWFNSDYFASNVGEKMIFPDFEKIAKAFSLDYEKILSDIDMESIIRKTLNHPNSIICEVMVSRDARVNPQVKFGSSIENMEPKLEEELIEKLNTLTRQFD
jgi:acetolactate synthase I/II/III large subunit